MLKLFHMKKMLSIIAALAVIMMPLGDFSTAKAWNIPLLNLVLSVVTPVPNPTFDTTPDITIRSNEVGTLEYNGGCVGNQTYINAVDDLTITFNQLAYGTYSNCKIKIKYQKMVNGFFQFFEETLLVPEFEVRQFVMLPIIDNTAPVLTEVTKVPTPSFVSTPEYTFHSTEAGDITVDGACSSTKKDAIAGNNTVPFNSLAPGTYSNCTITVIDTAGNVSIPLAVNTFTIQAIVLIPADYCAGFVDVSKTDSDCDAITYVKSIGAMTGNPNGTFEPDANLQRDQVAKISLETYNLFNAAQNYCSGNPFPDVTTNAWSYQYICRGVELGMITGYAAGADAGYYRPARSVNRVEFLALILRNLNETMPSVNSSSYKDVEPGHWYSGYAKYSYDNSLFTGASLYPDRFVTRREVAKAIYQLHELNKI